MDGVAGTDINAGTAINAFFLIDDHITVDFRDCAFRAFAFASAAVDAGIGINFMSHEFYLPLVIQKYKKYFTLVIILREAYHNWIKHVNKFTIKKVIRMAGKMSLFHNPFYGDFELQKVESTTFQTRFSMWLIARCSMIHLSHENS